MSADLSAFSSDGLDTNWLSSLNDNLSSDPSLSDIGTMDLTSQNDASLGSDAYNLWQDATNGDGSWASLTDTPTSTDSGSGNFFTQLLSSLAGGHNSGGGTSGNGVNFLSSLFGGNGNAINSILGLASGAYGLTQANMLKNLGEQAISASNPFGPYRAQYAQKLSALASNPGSITSDPGYQAAFDSGTQAVARQMAASGYAGSGNEAIALQQYGQNFENNYYNQQMDRLAQLAGATITPNPGPGLNSIIAGIGQAGSSLGSLGYGASMANAAAGGGNGTGNPNGAGGQAAGVGSGTGSTVQQVVKAGTSAYKTGKTLASGYQAISGLLAPSLASYAGGAAADAAVTSALGTVGSQTAGEAAAIEASNDAALGGTASTAGTTGTSSALTGVAAYAVPLAIAAAPAILGKFMTARDNSSSGYYGIGGVNSLAKTVQDATNKYGKLNVNPALGKTVSIINPNGTVNQDVSKAFDALTQMQVGVGGAFGVLSPYAQQKLNSMGYKSVAQMAAGKPVVPSNFGGGNGGGRGRVQRF